MNTADELDAFFERVPEHVLTVVDQAYFEYIDRPDYPDAVERYLKAGRRVAVLRTFSKIYGLAGLRVGYAVSLDRPCARAMAKVRRPFDLTTPAQVAAARQHRRRRRARAAARRQRGRARAASTTILRGHGFDPRTVRRQLRLRRDRRATRVALFERLLREGVIVRPLAGLRRADRDPRLRRHRRRARFFSAALGRVLAARLRPSRLAPGAVAVTRQLGLLRRAGSFRLLFLATLGSGIGTWMATIALTVDVDARTHSPWWVARSSSSPSCRPSSSASSPARWSTASRGSG